MRKKNTVRKRRQKGSLTYEMVGLFLFLLGIFIAVALFVQNAGLIGSFLRDGFHFLFGIGAFPAALAVTAAGAAYMYGGSPLVPTKRWTLIFILSWALLAAVHQLYAPEGRELFPAVLSQYGGLLGGSVVTLLRYALGPLGTTLALVGILAADLLFLTHWSLSGGLRAAGAHAETQVEQVGAMWKENAARRKERKEKKESEGHFFDYRDGAPSEAPLPEEAYPEEAAAEEGECTERVPLPDEAPEELPEETAEEEAPENFQEAPGKAAAAPSGTYRFPPLSLLQKGKGRSGEGAGDVEEKAKILDQTFKSFGITVRIVNVSVGPTITRYEIEPAPGVKVSRITNLSDDIALQLAASRIRIEAPIPGKSAIGIEVPNKTVSEVRLRDVIESDAFQKGTGGVKVALGEDIAGHPAVTDLTRMPHLLIAGSTGSGKSVCINSLIMSILYHSRPDDVKLILIDPKVVELSVYNGIPYLKTPVVTSPRQAAGALHWAVKEMEARYQLFSGSRVRDIGGYNEAHPDKKMPFIVIIIDELADLMQVASSDVEEAICRLAQKARAAGIHLVLATQRPSVDVITGVIKANIPSRISFAVSSQIDSRTILDMAGAEKLIGKGDMLFAPIGAAKPVRIQGAFVSDGEVEKVTDFIKKESLPAPVKEEEPVDFSLPEEKEGGGRSEEADPLLYEAAEWVTDTGKASVSMLQRRFRIGYTRAGRLMDTLEEKGIVGPADGARPREVLKTKADLPALHLKKEEMP